MLQAPGVPDPVHPQDSVQATGGEERLGRVALQPSDTACQPLQTAQQAPWRKGEALGEPNHQN